MPKKDNDENWITIKKVYPPQPPKWCEGENCGRPFVPIWPAERRCARCRKEKRPYKKPDNPF